MKLDNLKKLYVEQLKDLYSAEGQLVEALPRMAKAAKSPILKQAFEEHLEETKQHRQRIERLFEGLDYSPHGQKCKGMEGLIEEGDEAAKQDGDDDTIDAAMIAAAQRVEHYEIAGYGTVHQYALLLGEEHAARTLQTTLDEEYGANIKLNKLSETINVEAIAGR
jgi:ferritin-like metal-binding protein YciE